MRAKTLTLFLLFVCCLFVNIVSAKETIDTFDLSFCLDRTVSATTKTTTSSNDTNPNGYSIAGECLYYFVEGSALGVGINYNSVEDNNFYLTNVYAVFKQLVPINIKAKSNDDVNFFAGISLGSNCDYGKIFWKIFCGIDINKFMFFLNYSQNYMSYSIPDGRTDMSYSKIALGIGLRFNCKNTE